MRLHLHVGHRIAELVGDAAGDGAAARQAEVDSSRAPDRSAISSGLPAFERARLSVLERDVSGLVDEQAIASGRKRSAARIARRCRS